MEEKAHNKPQPSLQDWRDLDPGSSGPTIPAAGGTPQERSPLLGGGGWAGRTMSFSDLRLARLMVSLRAAGACVRVPPPAP